MVGENFPAEEGMCQKHKHFVLMFITINQQNQRDRLFVDHGIFLR